MTAVGQSMFTRMLSVTNWKQKKYKVSYLLVWRLNCLVIQTPWLNNGTKYSPVFVNTRGLYIAPSSKQF